MLLYVIPTTFTRRSSRVHSKESNMLQFTRINSEKDFPATISRSRFIDFLHTHLGQYRDTSEAIALAIDYAFTTTVGKGGFLLLAHNNNELIGAVVMNRTGMEGYIPENILVYIAVDEKYRGQGFGRTIVERIMSECEGAIALHVEYDNPARRLYERLGFSSKYAEMRYSPPTNS